MGLVNDDGFGPLRPLVVVLGLSGWAIASGFGPIGLGHWWWFWAYWAWPVVVVLGLWVW